MVMNVCVASDDDVDVVIFLKLSANRVECMDNLYFSSHEWLTAMLFF